ncbi:MAG: MMPL family transporter [Planctomycetota bacterium]
MATIFMLGFVPRGVRKAIESNVNKAEDWLPNNYPESTDLRWFAKHFIGAKFVLVSWEGCTLAEEESISRVVEALRKQRDKRGDLVYSRILSGPEQVASLTVEPSNLSRSAAIRRVEGALVGPPQQEPAAFTDNEELTSDERQTLSDLTRTTCLVAYMRPYVTDNNARMRRAIEQISDVVVQEVGVTAEEVHLGGPPVDNVTIDIEGEKTLIRLAGFSGLVGFALSFWCFRSLRLTWFVFSVSGISAGVSLAIVYWYGVFEVNGLGLDARHLGTVDAILMSMPAVVYVLGLSGAIHIVNYYRDERDARGIVGAAERGVRIGWGPCALAALTTAVGLGSLGASQIIPIKKFGIFSAAGVMATVLVLLAILPVCLHLFPPKLPGDDPKKGGKKPKRKRCQSPLPGWAAAHAAFVTQRYGIVTTVCLTAMAFFAYGLTKTDTEVRLLKLLDPSTKLIHDYAWFEENLGNLVPMEVVIALTDDQLRSPNERSDDGPQYRMTMYERLKMVERVQQRIEALGPVSRAMSAATFGPAERQSSTAMERRATDYTISEALEESRGALAEYLATEHWDAEKEVSTTASDTTDKPRELWRISARVAALSDGSGNGVGVDYGDFVVNLQHEVEPVLDLYRLRDELVRKLNEQEKSLVGSRVALVFDAASGLTTPPEASDDAMMIDLLRESGVAWKGGKLFPINAAKLRAAGDNSASYKKTLASLDAVVTVSKLATEAVKPFATDEVTLVSLDERGADTAPMRAEANAALQPAASLDAVYTGIVPLVYKTQRELLTSLTHSIGMATILIAGVMIVVLRSPGGGLVSMIPNVFPIVSVFGSLGWLGIKVDIGIMMTASVALGVAVDDTIHFLTWFRRGIVRGLDRRSATLLAFDHCAIAMTQTTLIAGLGLAVFATSSFTPTQEFGYLMITMLGAALVGDLVMLPAILCGPLGRFFAPSGTPAKPLDDTPAAAPQTATPVTPKAETPAPAEPTPVSDDAEVASNGQVSEGQLSGDYASSANGHASTAGPASTGHASTGDQDGAGQPGQAEPVVTTPHSPPPEPLSPSNAALRAKLQKLRRQ